MAYDRGSRCGVACLTLLFACGPSVKPDSVPPEPRPVGQGAAKLKVDPQGRRVVIGEMCPEGAGGRAAVAPLIMRSVGWTDAAVDVNAQVERGTVPRFVVFGVDGKPAGSFDTLGVVDIAPGQTVASGTYVGASPCTYGVNAKPNAGAMDTRGEDPKCGPVTKSCGIAVGEITGPNEPEVAATFTTGGACLAGTDLAVDIDGDGTIESFPLAGVLDGIRAPAAEWSASATATATCTPTFHVYGLKLAGEPRTGKAPPLKGAVTSGDASVTIDVLGVVDVDGDGRRELILAMRFPTVRSIVVYTAPGRTQRLELAGEAPSFAR